MEKNDQLFASLIYIFQATAMQGLGKIKNPVTDKIERNMEQAQQAIDMLEMIKDKTKGNLSSEMARLLDTFLNELRLNYIDEAGKP
ncbi:MAG: DUF1844 domain-containing protein [Bacteroidota bacterium]